MGDFRNQGIVHWFVILSFHEHCYRSPETPQIFEWSSSWKMKNKIGKSEKDWVCIAMCSNECSPFRFFTTLFTANFCVCFIPQSNHKYLSTSLICLSVKFSCERIQTFDTTFYVSFEVSLFRELHAAILEFPPRGDKGTVNCWTSIYSMNWSLFKGPKCLRAILYHQKKILFSKEYW